MHLIKWACWISPSSAPHHQSRGLLSWYVRIYKCICRLVYSKSNNLAVISYMSVVTSDTPIANDSYFYPPPYLLITLLPSPPPSYPPFFPLTLPPSLLPSLPSSLPPSHHPSLSPSYLSFISPPLPVSLLPSLPLTTPPYLPLTFPSSHHPSLSPPLPPLPSLHPSYSPYLPLTTPPSHPLNPLPYTGRSLLIRCQLGRDGDQDGVQTHSCFLRE